MKTILDFIVEHWLELIGPLLYEIAARFFPTKKNISIIDNLWKFLNWIIPNVRKPDGTERVVEEKSLGTKKVKNEILVNIARHILKTVVIVMIVSSAAHAQIWQNFKGVRLVNQMDSTQVLPVNGSIYYNEQSDKFRCYQNNVWVDCITTSSSGLTTADNGLTVIPAGNVRLGGTLIQNTTVNGDFGAGWTMSFSNMGGFDIGILSDAGGSFGVNNSSSGSSSSIEVSDSFFEAHTTNGGTGIATDVAYNDSGITLSVNDGTSTTNHLQDPEHYYAESGDGVSLSFYDISVDGHALSSTHPADDLGFFRFTTDNLSATNIAELDVDGFKLNYLTSGRAPFVATAGLITDEAAYTYDASTNTLGVLNTGGASLFTANGSNVTINNGAAATTVMTGANTTLSNSGSQIQLSQGGLSSTFAAGITFSTTAGNITITPTGFFVLTGLPADCTGAPTGAIFDNGDGILRRCP